MVRFLVAVVAIAAVSAFFLVPIPMDKKTDQPQLPSTALNQTNLYRGEIALLVFYGSLLLLTPAFAGVIRGRLPTEISARGAKFELAEQVDQPIAETQETLKKLEGSHNNLRDEFALTKAALQKSSGGAQADDAEASSEKQSAVTPQR
jgi:hypothetical protein